MTVLATIQCHVTADVHANGREVRAAMRQAAEGGARVAHFPEAALSGYVKQHIADWSDVDWAALELERERTAALAAELGLWIVLGGNHRLPGGLWPHNSLHVIDDKGAAAGRYDKRFCSNTELSWWYTPGAEPLVFEVDGVRFGTALCIEVCFPEVFAEYARLGVDCVLVSSFSVDPVHGVMAQAHAATTCVWLSLSTPVSCSLTLPSAQFGPDGYPISTARAGVPGVLLHRIDRSLPRYHVALNHARPWRARALSGEIYASRRVEANGIQANSDEMPELLVPPVAAAACPAATR